MLPLCEGEIMCAVDARAVMERRTLQAAQAAAQVAPAGAMIAAAAALPAYDPVQRFVRLVPGGNGIIYGIQADGALMWYRHTTWQNGTVGWANGGAGRQIGSGFQQFRAVVASENG